ncbi:hypothetical protein [Actinoplanes sp. NPDC051411]|uniref:hypothetical protein n=1 Tax=Actinoplanes sp. NPDC051411 TaxID=3155522 RepID=UPI0034288321
MNDQTRRAPPGELTGGQVDALRALLESELRSALGAARERGHARAAIDATIADRGRLLGESVHDRQDRLDQGGKGGAVVEQG